MDEVERFHELAEEHGDEAWNLVMEQVEGELNDKIRRSELREINKQLQNRI